MLKNKNGLVSALSAVALFSSINNVSATEMDTILETFPKQGSELPYSVLRADLKDAKTQLPFDIRNGGYGSAMTAHPTQTHQFYALTDRGPNASHQGQYGKGKSFPVADYTPRIGLFEVKPGGKIVQLKDILLKRPDGHLISGLPNSSALGGDR
ncbi:hypothetical protein [Psychromonas sp. SP041]|uniref:hypothetical protein n=1 Tax=Psychromonas sp. SP041 TaxID=1365007 RepID=UPI0004210A27|nr:hypothetical protein [Psychromonas sp. SP041]